MAAMKRIFIVSCICLVTQQVTAPPPRRNEEEKKEVKSEEKDELDDFNLEYNRYLKEVVDLLESDQEFKRKLEQAHEADIRSGKIAEELEYVNHNVRTKLDEVKRQEVERLRHLAQKEFELKNGIDVEHVKVSSEHLDHENPHTFEMKDLQKLIAKVSSDLNEADKKRRQEFKEYEMQKEFEKQERLKHLEGSEKEAFEKQIQENDTKHKQHEPLHHPGSKQQFEEVWEKQDHMENQDFDPKIFFNLHDLDGNGYWDHNEVKTLFLKELDKMYQAGAPEDDMRERVEEMERMREHVFGEADKNKDGLISFKEFLEKTKQPDFEKDPGWESLDQKPVYTMDEYKEFERRRQEEIQRMIQQGLIPPQPVYQPYAGYHYPQGYGQPQAQYHPQQYVQGHPNQIPQGYHPQAQQGHPNQIPQEYHPQVQQGHPNQMPQAHPNQMAQGHPNQMAQGHPNQGPQGHPNQVPQGHPGQIPGGHPNQFQQGPPQQVAQEHFAQIHQIQNQGNVNPNSHPQVPQGQPNPYPSQGQGNQVPHAQSNEVHHPNLNAHPNDVNVNPSNLKSQQAQPSNH